MFGKTQNNKQIVAAMGIIMAIAMVFSCVSSVFADNSKGEVSSWRTANTAIIKGTENWGPDENRINAKDFIANIGKSTGIYQIINGATPPAAHVESEDPYEGLEAPGWQKLLMIAVGFLIVYMGAAKGFEPLLLIPIGFGTILVNIPGAGMYNPGTGMLRIIYDAGVGNEFFPMLIFMGIGAMTDFGPLIANPKMALLGGAAQFGVFATLFGVALLNFIPGIDYNMKQPFWVVLHSSVYSSHFSVLHL